MAMGAGGGRGRLSLSVGHCTMCDMATRSFTIKPLGEFSLAESALFGFGQRMRPVGASTREAHFDGIMRLAFCLTTIATRSGSRCVRTSRGCTR